MATFNNSEISEIVRNLKKRGAKIEQATKAAVKESAEEIVRVAKFLAPVRTGNLQNSIHCEIEDNGLIYKISADAKNVKGTMYARIVEFDPRINKPFLYPAINKTIDGINDKIKQAVKGVI